MPKPLTIALTQVYGSVAEDLKRRIGDAQAAQAGPPVASGIKPASDKERLKLWNERRPEATDEAMAQLAAERYAAHKQAGLPDDKAVRATAEDLTHFRYAGRIRVYSYGQTTFKEQVEEAKRMRRVAERETTPNPPAPPPTMPTAALTNLASATPAAPASAAAAGMPTGAPAAPQPPSIAPPAVPESDINAVNGSATNGGISYGP